jgi:hypothetical protein
MSAVRLRTLLGAVVIAAALVCLQGCSPGDSGASRGPSSPSGRATSRDRGALVTAPPTTVVVDEVVSDGIAATPSGSSTTGPGGPAAVALSRLPVKGRASRTGYSRIEFGQPWSDDVTVVFGHNGCDTRNDILRRDLSNQVIRPRTNGCLVKSGILVDPCTAVRLPFLRGSGTSNRIQIDHVVALGNAWQTGAQHLTPDQRRDLANDPLNLLATGGPTNQAKGDSDAASWLPPNRAIRCDYVARQIAVKASYGLWVTRPERDALSRVLSSCPQQPLPTTGASRLAVRPGATPDSSRSVTTAEDPPAATTGSAADPRFSSCRLAKGAGYGPYRRGVDPEYDSYDDGDGDGIVCE